MPRALLRVGTRNRAAWESADVDQIMKLDFRLRDGAWDFRPSVYEIEADDDQGLRRLAVRVHAEHTASFLRPPRHGSPSFDVDGLAPGAIDATPGQTQFEYANRCHREIALTGERELRQLIVDLLAGRAIRERAISLDDLLRYIAERLDADDPEWLAASVTDPGHNWAKPARRFRASIR